MRRSSFSRKKFKKRKINRFKGNLYRNNDKTKKILGGIGFGFLIFGLGFVGYFAAPPFIDFFKNSGDAAETNPWTPNEDSTSQNTSIITKETTTEIIETEPENENGFKGNVLFSSYEVLKDKDTFTTFLKDAKEKGYSTVLLEMKNDIGEIYYKSNLAVFADTASTEKIVKGSLTLSEIIKLCEDEDILPSAYIHALKDRLAAENIPGISYKTIDGYKWADDFIDRGGKQWANPQSSETAVYIASITGEIAAAGFKNIVVDNLIFAPMRSYDAGILPSSVTNISNRYMYLGNILTAIHSSLPDDSHEIYVKFFAKDYEKESSIPQFYSSSTEFLKYNFPKIPFIIEFSEEDEEKDKYNLAKSSLSNEHKIYPMTNANENQTEETDALIIKN